MASAAVIGAGIAGLTAAYQLQERGLDVRIFEASGRVGGAIRSLQRDGYLVECGPSTLQRTTPVLERLITSLGLDEHIVEADAAASKRFIVRGGVARALPSSPPGLVTTPLFSAAAKLRLLAEPLVGAAPPDVEESISTFARRRLGREPLDYAVDPFISGIYAGDPARLSLQHAFPTLYELEQEYGSLLVGAVRKMLRKRRKGGHTPARRRGLFTFRGGLQALPDALGEALSGVLQLHAPVTALAQQHGRWRITVDGAPHPEAFDAVVYAAPTYALDRVDFEGGPDLSPLQSIEYPPVTVVALGFRREQVAHPLDGFGVLVPSVEDDYRILGALFISSLFPARAPDRHVLISAFVGGSRRPALAGLAEDELTALVLDDVHRLLGVRGAPAFRHVHAWPHAIPQYTLGYGAKKALMDRTERSHRGLFFAGNYRGGISVGDSAASGHDAARRVAKQYGPRTRRTLQ